MKKVLVSLTLVLSCFAINAQMARWIMQPEYDKIYMASGTSLLICDSLGTSSIWSIKGKKLAVTNDVVHPFKEGLSVTTQKNTENITGFFDDKGMFTSLRNYTVTYDEPFFRDGYLLVKSKNRYCFINENGEEENFGHFVKIYPFNNGFATCFTYEQMDRLKNPYCTYITADNGLVTFSYNNKIFEKRDVEFLSSINDAGIGLAIIKSKVYLFDKNTCSLEPFFANNTGTNRKKQVVVDGKINEYLTTVNDTIVIRGKSNKKEVIFKFDKLLRLINLAESDSIVGYKTEKMKTEKYNSSFSSIESNGKYGLNYNGKTVLPVQFDEVGFCLNDFAVVRMDDKWGVLTYDKNLKYRFIIHDGKDIAFRHKFVATTIKLELPAIISADKCRFDIDENYGCNIDKISLETKNTENGNYVQYNCNLTIPDSLSDVITEIQYPVQITYDRLKYSIVPIKTKAWHYKYINVDLDENETVLEQGNVSFTIKISTDKQLGENDYPFEVKILTDSLQTELVKISETRYKCKLYALAEGVNKININILESGCPPYIFPFEITYIKPVKKSRNKPEVKEEIKIEKKVKAEEPAEPVKPTDPVLPI